MPSKWCVNTLSTLNIYATIISSNCDIGMHTERDSSHYVDDTYYLWNYLDCKVKLYWCDEDDAEEYLCISVYGADEDAAMSACSRICECVKKYSTKILRDAII